MSIKYSPYFYVLEEAENLRYTQKLNKLGGIDDPFVQEPNVAGKDWECWPSVEYPDIYNYLIQTPGLYTGESSKAYKSLDAYNFYVNGWIDEVKVGCSYCAAGRTSLPDSQKLSAPPTRQITIFSVK